MANHIRGNNDGPNGENATYTVHGRGRVPRKQLVKEVKDRRHPSHSIYTLGDVEYVRANSDNSEHNNINKN